MKLRNVEFGSVIGASGVQGFFGKGYPYHAWLKSALGDRFSFDGMTFTAKTTTLNPKPGNMPLQSDGITPEEWRPKCIVVKPWKGVALNAVGLSGPGARALFDTGKWQARTDNFFLSFMSVAATPQEREKEFVAYTKMLRSYLPDFKGNIGHQINLSCPNVGLHSTASFEEAHRFLDIAGDVDIPWVPKINLLVDPYTAARIADHKNCHALCVSNTLPWGSLPDRIDWKGLFGTSESPLKEFGGGGLSGAPLLPLLIEWLDKARHIVKKPIIAGGGILGSDDVKRLSYCHPAAVSVGSITMLRPWRLAETIRVGREVL